MPLSRALDVAAFAVAAFVVSQAAGRASAQVVVYESLRPVVAAPVTSHYTPAGNYAAVTAFSPPVVASVPTSSVAVTSYFAPAVAAAVPVTSFYAPAGIVAPVATTAYYAPAPAVVAAPVTTYYSPGAVAVAPAAVAVPLYRRGLFGGYRPVRAAYYPY